MTKALGAFLLGVLSVPVAFVFGGMDAYVFGIVMAAYFFICQFWLSRGNPHAFLKDWPFMLLLNAVLFLFLFIGFFVPENLTAAYAVKGLAILLVCFTGTLVGALVASRAASRKAREQ